MLGCSADGHMFPSNARPTVRKPRIRRPVHQRIPRSVRSAATTKAFEGYFTGGGAGPSDDLRFPEASWRDVKQKQDAQAVSAVRAMLSRRQEQLRRAAQSRGLAYEPRQRLNEMYSYLIRPQRSYCSLYTAPNGLRVSRLSPSVGQMWSFPRQMMSLQVLWTHRWRN